jgi:hypothetical protein
MNLPLLICQFDLQSDVIFFDDFSSLTTGTPDGTQVVTGYPLRHSTAATGWTASGTNAFHMVSAAGTNAVLIHSIGNNEGISNAILSSNLKDVQYVLEFRTAPGAWSSDTKASIAADTIRVEIRTATGSVVASKVVFCGAYPSSGVWSFTNQELFYVGDGTGDIKIRFGYVSPNVNRMTGAIANFRLRRGISRPTIAPTVLVSPFHHILYPFCTIDS